MRRLFAALIVVTVALTLAGCGGGDEAVSDAPAESEVVPAPPAAADDQAADLGDDFSPEVDGFPRSFPTDQRLVPDEIRDRLDVGQPMLVFFYDEERDVVDDVEDVIESVMAEYRGLVDRIDYPIADDVEDVLETGDFGDDLTDAEIEQKKKLYELADELGVGTTPFLVLVDRMGGITWMGRGYVDQETLELKVLHATQ